MSFSAGEDSESCAVCMEQPCTMRYGPCGHAVCCELCTIKACEPSQRRLRCPTCREEVAQLELMEGYEAAAQTGALSYESVPVFLHAMFNSAAQEVADAARTAHDHWGKYDEGELEAVLRNAAEAGNAAGVTIMLMAAPDLNVNAENGAGYTALTLAAFGGHTETVTALLAAPGLDVNTVDVDVMTALIELAVARGHGEVATALRLASSSS